MILENGIRAACDHQPRGGPDCRTILLALGDTYANYLLRTFFGGYVWAGTRQTAARPCADEDKDVHLIIYHIRFIGKLGPKPP